MSGTERLLLFLLQPPMLWGAAVTWKNETVTAAVAVAAAADNQHASDTDVAAIDTAAVEAFDVRDK